MSAFEAYQDYVALKNHFNKPDYDYIKYNGKTGVKQSSFVKRKDKVFFEKLAKNPDYHEFLIANFSVNPKLWIRDIAYSEIAQSIYQDWKKRNQSLAYIFKNELSKLHPDFNLNFTCSEGHPHLFRLFLGGYISLETICILLEMSKAIKYWDDSMEYDPIWEEYRMKIKKYTPFIKYDKEKIREIIINFFENK